MTRPLVALLLISAAPIISGHGADGGKPGSYARMGFGTRGIGMGNAQIGLISGDIIGYNNPAAIPFATSRYGSATFGFLSLDRNLNFLGYSQPLKPRAGLSAGIINSGVGEIDGRDSDGEQTGTLTTSENQIFLTFGIALGSQYAIGVGLKFLHYRLYDQVTSTTVGVDFGAIASISTDFSIGVSIRDINAKYSWDTSPVLGQSGLKVEEPFPTRYGIGLAYHLIDSLALLAADLEFSSDGAAIARIGAEVQILPELTFRSGVDRIDLKDKGAGVVPAIGFSIHKGLDTWTPAFHYVFVIEPFSPSGIHMISLSARF